MAKKRYDKPETRRKWNEANREKLLEQQRARRRLHPERVKHQNDKYKAENPEKIKEIAKKYYWDNRDKHIEHVKQWRKENPERYNAQRKKWRDENPEKMQACRDAWLEENRDYKKQKEAEWREANIDKTSIKGRKRYRDKKDHCLAVSKKWRKANPEKYKQIGARRRARIKGVIVGDTKIIAAWEKEWRSKESAECAYCHQSFPPSDCDTDHVIPLTRGGAHELSNLAIACWWCNRSKHNRTLEEWLAVKLDHPTSAPDSSSSFQSSPEGSTCHPPHSPHAR